MAAWLASEIPMTSLPQRAWLDLYRGVPPTIEPGTSDRPRHVPRHGARAAATRCWCTTSTGRSPSASIDAMSDALAVALQRRGVEPGDRVAMYLQNIPQVLVTVLAAWKCGAVIVPCNPMLRERELVKILSDSGSRVLVCQDDLYADVARAALPSTAVQHTITTSPLDFLTPGAPLPPVLAGVTRRAARRTCRTCSSWSSAHAGAGAGAGGAHRRRRGVHGLHVGHDRRAEGGDEHAPQRRVRDVGLRALDRPDRGGHDPRAGAAVPRDRPDRPRHAGDADRQPAGAVLPVRRRGGAAGSPQRIAPRSPCRPSPRSSRSSTATR